jgi:glycosyltransferase involved in cell wall biosynthesis
LAVKRGRMKILQVISYFNPKFGGDVNVCTNLSKTLAKGNHEVTIITTDFHFDSQFADTIRAEGITVIPFHCITNFGLFLYSPSIKFWLEKNLKKYNIIHLHNYRSYQNISVCSCAGRFRVPYILQAHGSVLPFFEKQSLKRMYDFAWGNKILNDATKFIAVSNIEKDQYLKMGIPDNKIVIIANGIDVAKYGTITVRGKFRKKYGISSDKKIILFLGRLHKRKGIDFLINGFSILQDQYKDVNLVIAGPDAGYLGMVTEQIKKGKIDKKVLIVGQVSEEEKIEAFVDADMLVYPGIFEIFGLVPFEAILCGTPVIVTDDCGCGEIVKEANCGLIVKFGEVEQLKDQMIKLIDNPDESKNLVANGQEYIYKNLRWDNLIKKFESVYNSCI